MVILTGRTIVSAVTPPYPYGAEFVSQFMFALRLCWLPLLISTIAFGYEAPGLQAANFLVLFGALDRLGGFFVLASIREFAPFVDAIVLAGVAGTGGSTFFVSLPGSGRACGRVAARTSSMTVRRRVAASLSTSSPAMWPSVSLIDLNSSRSM